MTLDDFEPDSNAPEPIDTSPDESSRIELPTVWGEKYSADDKQAVTTAIGWLNEHRLTQVSLARKARIAPETFSQVIRGKYPSSPTKFLARVGEAISNEDERRASVGIPFVETTAWRLAKSAYHRARTYRNMGVLSGNAGTGKTQAAKHYADVTPNSYVVECIEKMSPSAFCDELIRLLQLGYETRGASKEKKFLAIVAALRDTDAVVIVDEAESLGPETLEYCRRLRDLARIGVVLQGKPNLVDQLQPNGNGGRFDQIRSRIGFWPPSITGITRADADEVTLAAFAEIEDGPDHATLDAMWDVAGGSIRLLTESLIPALRDFGLRKGRTLTPQLVRQIAAEALRIKSHARREG